MFSEFRELMDKWDSSRRLMLENELCLFFKKDGRLYGATETARITFARMKNPEGKDDKAWAKDATFAAYDLEKTADGNESTSVFGAADLPDLEMIDEDKAIGILKKKGKSMPAISDDEEEKAIGEK